MGGTPASDPGWSEGGGGQETWNIRGRRWRPYFLWLVLTGTGGHGPLGSPPGSAAAHSRGCTILWLGGVRRHDGAFPFSHLQDSGGRWCYGPLFLLSTPGRYILALSVPPKQYVLLRTHKWMDIKKNFLSLNLCVCHVPVKPIKRTVLLPFGH